MKPELKRDIERLLTYVWVEEQRHYEESRTKNHIFLTIQRIAKAVGWKVNAGEGGKP